MLRPEPERSHDEGGRSGASTAQRIARLLLGVALITVGVGHLTWLREEFQAQVPSWLPADPDLVVLVSGVVEVLLGVALLLGVQQRRVGWVVAAFFVAVFPGNVAQYLDGTDAFGLTSDGARLARLAVQPALIAWALWSTGAWPWTRHRSSAAA